MYEFEWKIITLGSCITDFSPKMFKSNEIVIDIPVYFGDCSLVRRFCSPKVRKSEIKGSSFRRFCSPKVRKSDNDFYSFLL